MYIIKCILYIAILFACIRMGTVIAQKYTNRYKELKECTIALSILQTKIEYTMQPISEIFKEIAEKTNPPISLLFQTASENIEKCNAAKAWDDSLENVWTNLKEEDKNVLKDLGKMLGKTDIDGQVKEIKLVEQFLNTQIEEAMAEKNKNEKLYKTLGIVSGLTIVIMLL